jgi:hypothetical protein
MSARRCFVVVFVLFIVAISGSACCGLPCGGLCGSLRTGRVQVLRGSGDLVTRDMDLSGFTRLEIGYSFRVYLTQSDEYGVNITVDDNIRDRLVVAKSGDTLKIGLEPGALSVQNVTLEAEVSMPTLEGVNLSGASRLTGEMNTRDVSFEVSGASGASTVTVHVTGRLNAHASGASRVEYLGDPRLGNIDTSGASSVRPR